MFDSGEFFEEVIKGSAATSTLTILSKVPLQGLLYTGAMVSCLSSIILKTCKKRALLWMVIYSVLVVV